MGRVAENTQEDFPRGGGELLSAADLKKINEEVEEELAGLKVSGKKRERAASSRKTEKRAKKEPAASVDEEDFLGREQLIGKVPKYVEVLRYKAVSVGLRVWGSILEVNPGDLVVSLPGGLRGFVKPSGSYEALAEVWKESKIKKKAARRKKRLEEASGNESKDAEDADLQELEEEDEDVFSMVNYFSAGQLVSGVVTGLGTAKGSGKKTEVKRIELSLRLAHLNDGLSVESVYVGMPIQGCVWSVEDHGYLVSFGLKNLSGFLLKADAGVEGVLRKGQRVYSIVTSIDKKRRTLGLKLDPQLEKGLHLREFDGLNLHALQPGWLVNARVRSVLSDGLVLSFLTYFTGTVDRFHLGMDIPPLELKSVFQEGQRLQARVLFVDANTKRIGLTLNKRLVDGHAPEVPVAMGAVFDEAVVRRIEPAVGLLAELPRPESTPCAAFAHISELSDERIEKVEKAFRLGQKVCARVIGHRLMDNVAIVSLKASVLEQVFWSHNDVTPGSVVKGEVVVVDSFGALVQLSETIRALCPLQHMSELPLLKPSSKFKVGVRMKFRVLSCDPATKKIALTHKKTLLSSKLLPLVSYDSAVEGVTVTHGYITSVKDYGCFVSFYGNVKGLAHRSELGIDSESKPEECFQVGQVVKCRVLRCDMAKEKLSLSFVTSRDRRLASEEDNSSRYSALKVGAVVPATITDVRETAYSVQVEVPGGGQVQALLPFEHLADFPALVERFQEVLKPGVQLDRLRVLENEEAKDGKRHIMLTAKPAIVDGGDAVPADFSQLKTQSVVIGYLASITERGCFVRFLGRLTGLATPAHLKDTFVGNPAEAYSAGQTVRACIMQVNEEEARFNASLKPSLCFSLDATYLRSYFVTDEKIAVLRAAAEGTSLDWLDSFSLGTVVKGSIQEVKEYGIVVELSGHHDVVGFVSFYQAGGEVKAGQRVKGVVLDVSRGDGIVDLSLRPELVSAHDPRALDDWPSSHEAGGGGKVRKSSNKNKRKKEKALPQAIAQQAAVMHQLVEGIIEIVKDEYLVMSLPIYEHAIAFASIHDFNSRVAQPLARFTPGSRVVASVQSLGEPETGGRILLLLSSSATAPSAMPRQLSKKQRQDNVYEPGSVVVGKVVQMEPLFAVLQLGPMIRGFVHVSEVRDDGFGDGTNPLKALAVGQLASAKILRRCGGNSRSAGAGAATDEGVPARFDLTMRPQALLEAEGVVKEVVDESMLMPGREVVGYMQEAREAYAWIQLSGRLRGRLSVLESSNDPEQLRRFWKRWKPGQPIRCRIANICTEDKSKGPVIDLTLRKAKGGWDPRPGGEEGPSGGATWHLWRPAEVGDILGGRIRRVLPGGWLSVQVGGPKQEHGTVAPTDSGDFWGPTAGAGFREGHYVRCVVVGAAGSKGEGRGQGLQLSLRQSLGGQVAGRAEGGEFVPAINSIEDLCEGQEVKGYVKVCSRKGCFVWLTRDIDALVLLCNLSDTFVEDPEAEFPPGKLVTGRILSVEPLSRRVEMTLSSKDNTRGAGAGARARPSVAAAVAPTITLGSLKEGDVVRGRVKRIESFGLFIAVEGGVDGLTGLCHVSEVADKFVKDLHALFEEGMRVRAKVKKVDLEAKRLSLLMKSSAFNDDEVDEEEEEEEEVEEEEEEEGATEKVEAGKHGGMHGEQEAKFEESEEESEEEEKRVKLPSQASLGEGEKSRGGSGFGVGAAAVGEDVAPLMVMLEGDGDDIAWGVAKDMDSHRHRYEEEEEEEEEGTGGDGGGSRSTSKSKIRRDKKRAKEDRDRQVEEGEQQRLLASDASAVPQTPEDFERLVLASPNSSFLWIKYMACLLNLADADGARKVGERALATIHFRQETERLNVWIALLNLERAFGQPDPKEAVLRLFQRAQQHADPKKIHMALLGIYERAGETELVDQLLKSMTKKFSTSAKVWLRNIQSLLKRGMVEAMQRTLERALASLPKRKHIKVISRMALMEFKTGLADRGRTLMEGILHNYPKRVDLWSVYIDQELKLGDAEVVRGLFERAICVDLPPKKMKFIFKRYLDYEKQMKDKDRINLVKSKAMAYVEAKV